MAGISDPLKEIDVAEIYDAFSYMELLWSEGLGFCGKGEGGKLIDSGKTQMKGELPINPSGGVLSAHAVLVAGLARVANVFSSSGRMPEPGRSRGRKRRWPMASMVLAARVIV